ncbi:MAG: CHASE4 domain-containing protein, partial [Chloroflexota bacterium]
IISITIILVGLMHTSARLILLKSFSDMETAYCAKNVQRVLNTIANDNNHSLTVAGDYAAWDDTYTFVEDLNPAYVESNILPETFTSLNINFIIFTDNAGKFIASYGYDLVKNQAMPIPEDLMNLISKNPQFIELLNKKTAGIVLLKDGPTSLVSHPILTSKNTGPQHGLFIMGRFLGDEFASSLSETNQIPVHLDFYENSPLRLELDTAQPEAKSAFPLYIKDVSEEMISGYTIIQNIFGKPALIMRVDKEKDIFNQGQNTLFFYSLTVVLFSLLFIGAIIFLLDIQILSRIKFLSDAVHKIRSHTSLAERISINGKDEISSLTNEINQMLQSMEVSDTELRWARDELEERIEERTAELAQVNENLKSENAVRVRIQNALVEASNEIHQILGAISSIIIGVDVYGKVTQWNDNAAKMLDLSASAVIGADFSTLPIQWEQERLSLGIMECITKRTSVRVDDLRLVCSNSETRILGLTLSPLFLRDNEEPGFLLVGSDITDRRALELQLARSQKMEAIGQLAAGVAHEINTPTQLVGSNLRFLREHLAPILNLIQKYNQLRQDVKKGIATPEMAASLEKSVAETHLEYFYKEAPDAIEQSLDGIDRISKIVMAMRYFSHPGKENKEMADLNRIIENTITVSRNEWKNVAEVTTDLAPDLPKVECLPNELSQVFLNLIINAVHAIQDVAGEEPENKGRILITSRSLDKWVEICISDSGAGIPAEIRDRIFDLFFTTKEVGRGTGQGLAIAYNVIVNKHNGLIDFESDTGTGTKFIIRLPREIIYD